jgi:surface antigen
MSAAAFLHMTLTHSSTAHHPAHSLCRMKRKQKVGVWALVFGLIVLSLSACASSSSSAPIVYGGRPAPIISKGASRAPSAPLPPIQTPGPPIDLSTPVWDSYTFPRIDYTQAISQCVPFARLISGVQIWGDAYTWWDQAQGKYPRSSSPAEGSVLVLKGWNEDRRGHVAVVKAILSSRVIRVDHANWLHGEEVSLDVPVIDVSPYNDWTQVRVWHVPGMYWGGRIYTAQGFIHPLGPPPPRIETRPVAPIYDPSAPIASLPASPPSG